MNKSEVVKMLNEGIVTVNFTKADGTPRIMEATLDQSHISYTNATDVVHTKRSPDSVQAVWDISANGWRSFRWDSISGVNGENTKIDTAN